MRIELSLTRYPTVLLKNSLLMSTPPAKSQHQEVTDEQRVFAKTLTLGHSSGEADPGKAFPVNDF
jgi:hypothetical protein